MLEVLGLLLLGCGAGSRTGSSASSKFAQTQTVKHCVHTLMLRREEEPEGIELQRIAPMESRHAYSKAVNATQFYWLHFLPRANSAKHCRLLVMLSQTDKAAANSHTLSTQLNTNAAYRNHCFWQEDGYGLLRLIAHPSFNFTNPPVDDSLHTHLYGNDLQERFITLNQDNLNPTTRRQELTKDLRDFRCRHKDCNLYGYCNTSRVIELLGSGLVSLDQQELILERWIAVQGYRLFHDGDYRYTRELSCNIMTFFSVHYTEIRNAWFEAYTADTKLAGYDLAIYMRQFLRRLDSRHPIRYLTHLDENEIAIAHANEFQRYLALVRN